MKKIIGYFLIFLAFLGLFIVMGEDKGYQKACFVFGSTFVMAGLISLGAYLTTKE